MGGKTSGKWMIPSSTDLPKNFLRAKNQPTAIASGKVITAQISATLNDNCIADHSLAVYLNNSLKLKSVFYPDIFCFFRGQKIIKKLGLFVVFVL